MKENIQTYFTRKQICEIAIAYSSGNYSYQNFLQQYSNCNQHSFYTILHVAVEKAIVSEDIARKIQKVAMSNSAQKAQEKYSDPSYVACIKSRIFNSWEKRIMKARNFRFSKKEAKTLIENYSNSKLSKSEFCKVNCITLVLFDATMTDAIISNLIDDACFDRLYDKAMLQSSNSPNVEHLFWQLTKARKRNKASNTKR